MTLIGARHVVASMAAARTVVVATLVAVLFLTGCDESPQSPTSPVMSTHYRSVEVDGLSVFYREAGPADAPTILLLHGFPSSSQMFEPLFARLSDRYHLVAPDYPGFGHSDAPDPSRFAYTFDHLAQVVDHFTSAVHLSAYSLYVQDYGGPVGMRLAMAHPERLQSLIIQNAVSHEDGLGPLWATRRAFWADRAAHEDAVRTNLLSYAATRQRHVGSDQSVDRYDPDTWTAEFAALQRPGQDAIQLNLFYDYQSNVAAYPTWQAWLRDVQPKTLVVWGKYDPSFQVAEVGAYKGDLPNAVTEVLYGGHFALDTCADEIASTIGTFMAK